MATNPLVKLRRFLHNKVIVNGVRNYYNLVWKTKIGEGSRISLSVKMDKEFPEGIEIGKDTAVTFGVAIVTHDFVNNYHTTTKIGSNCFIGARSMIMPGVTIGDECIVGAGSIVLRDVPPNSVVMGNPARVIERGVSLGRFGKRLIPANGPAAVAAAAETPEPVPAVSKETKID